MSSKLEQEIEEILARTGGPPPPTKLRRPSHTGRRLTEMRTALAERVRAINPGQMMLASILIIIGSWFVLRRWDTAMLVVALFGLGLFVVAFVLSIWRRRSGGGGPGPTGQHYWRGQPLDYRPGGGFRNPFRRR